MKNVMHGTRLLQLLAIANRHGTLQLPYIAIKSVQRLCLQLEESMTTIISLHPPRSS